jgi:hypothetical protein
MYSCVKLVITRNRVLCKGLVETPLGHHLVMHGITLDCRFESGCGCGKHTAERAHRALLTGATTEPRMTVALTCRCFGVASPSYVLLGLPAPLLVGRGGQTLVCNHVFLIH